MIDESFGVNLILSSPNMYELSMAHRDCIDSIWSLPPRRRVNVLEPAAPRRVLLNLLSLFLGWRERARSRHLLQQLDDRMLRDVGLTRSDVDRECAKHFWQP